MLGTGWRLPRLQAGPGDAQGFTLIEMIVVVSLIVIFLSVGIPSMRQAIYADPLKTTARKMIGIVNEARQRAQEERQPYLIVIDRAQRKFWLEKDVPAGSAAGDKATNNTDSTGTADTADAAVKGEEQPLPDGVEIGELQREDETGADSDLLSIWISGKGYVNRTRLQLVNDDGDALFLDFQPFIAEVAIFDNADEPFAR